MGTLDRTAAETAIAQALQQHWGPEPPAAGDGGAPGYGGFAHELYTLLLRGGSDVQVERMLRAIELEQLHRPDLGSVDITPVVRSLRVLERSM